MHNKGREKALSKIVRLTAGTLYTSDIVDVSDDVLQN